MATVLLRFRVANWASIRDEQELSLVAADDHEDLAMREIPGTGLKALPVVGVLGANASGKSNLMTAMAYARDAVRYSHNRWHPRGGTGRVPFLLDEAAVARRSEFAFDFVLDGDRHEYGFAVDDGAVTSEWLYSWPRGRMRTLFEREGQEIELGPGLRRGFGNRTRMVQESVRPNSLFVSAGAAGNHPLLTSVYDWVDRITMAFDTNAPVRLDLTLRMLTGPERDLCTLLLRYADLGITGVRSEEKEMPKEATAHFAAGFRVLHPEGPPTDPEGWRQSPEIVVEHRTPGGSVELPYGAESHGTHTWLELVGVVVRALEQGRVLVVDELDARLHPNLAGQLVRLFSEPETNPRGAQLVFNTHDVTLLSRRSFGYLTRDQTWFTEKGADGATELVALREYKVRDDRDDVVKKYLLGAFSAVPVFDGGISDELTRLVAERALTCRCGAEEEAKHLSQPEENRDEEPQAQISHLL
ncbi:AAA family ATPase [Nocardiopsis alborubida]|uniref:ATP-binding protein n=1 Tax=Nocardiopsis alborubida TaxID=146802 RepID=A0A7X6RS89_9ACTN|nr:ATP-binding protein [Nocardiopsis alborubida]NKZ00088.1 ATP-binding protein [Nocardiopsis alborubida]